MTCLPSSDPFPLVVYGDLAWDVVVFAQNEYSRPDSDIVTGGISMHPGGSAANCAVTAARLGAPVSFVGLTGTDAISDVLAEDLEKNGVDTTHLLRVDSPPAVVVAIDDGVESRRFYSYRGAAAQVAYGPLPERLFSGRGWLHISGYSFQNDFSRTTALRLISRAKSAEWTISLDPSFHSAREFHSHMAQVLNSVDVLLPNLEEARLITGLEAPVPAAQAIQKLGLKVVVLKMGAQGCVVLADEAQELPGFVVDPIVDTIGAGDAFCGGFIVARLSGLAITPACIVANATAACTVRQPGGHTGSPTKEELLHFLRSRDQGQVAVSLENSRHNSRRWGRQLIDCHSFHFNPRVMKALELGQAVVALETTILSHGMPYPTNLETALAVEDIVREAGAVPATIGIVGGQVTVGLTEDQLEMFATKEGIVKAVERDIPMVVARGLDGATTVGCSLAIAAAAGIAVFVTGGIGAVAPEAGRTFDVSADLMAIASSPCITVCAGAKAFMDIAATLEYLETQSVPVVGYRTGNFPLFYCRDSGLSLDWSCDSVEEIALFFATQKALGFNRGLLVGVPIPAEDELEPSVLQGAIEVALAKAQATGKRGKEVTPFVLTAIKEATDGCSLAANVSLVKNNAGVGSGIANALARRRVTTA